VAKALGLDVVGWEKARPDPEWSGRWNVEWSDPEYADLHPVYLAHCHCGLRDEMVDGPDLKLLACGHMCWCLEVVPFYGTDIGTAVPLFERLGPAWCLSQSDSAGWDDAYRWWCWLPTEYGGDGTEHMAPTPAKAIRKAFLAEQEAQCVSSS